MDYFLRNIDSIFWHRLKIKALAHKMTIREIILDLLHKWVKEGKK